MDVVKRQYARTALAGLDPLKNVAPEHRLEILLMRPTWRERLRLAPWHDRFEKQQALRDIIAERRLAYELAMAQAGIVITLEPQAPPVAEPQARAYSSFQQRRLAAHRREQGRTTLQAERAREDRNLLASSKQAQALAARRDHIRARLLAIEAERDGLQDELEGPEHSFDA